MDAQIARLLESSDPKQRFNGIKQAARSKEVAVLKKLADIAQNDPDDQVRAVAEKAIAYIKDDSRAAAPRSDGRKREVSPKDEARAKSYLDAAISYQINGERDRALKQLAKAYSVNPNLESDAFFKSVLEEVTATASDEALNMVRSPDQLKAMTATEQQLKRERRKQEHLENVNRSSWGSVMMDLAILTVITIVFTALGLALAGQSATNYLDNLTAAEQAYRAGEIDALPEIDPVFREVAAQYAPLLTIPFSVMTGLATGIFSVISLLINLVCTHVAARFFFGGQATLPHLIYKVVSFYNSRLPLLYIIAFALIVLMFAIGGGIVPAVGAGIIGLYSLYLFFKTIGRISEAYDFGAGKGCLSYLFGIIIVAVISFVVQMLFLSTIMAMIASQFPIS